MALITLNDLYDKWKKVSDWVTGVDAVSAPPVQLKGSNAVDGQTLWTPGMLYNETTSDKPRGNTQGTLLASAARTVTLNTANQTNYNAKGVIIYLNVTAVPVTPGSGGLNPSIVSIDSISGGLAAINAAVALITTVGIYAIEVYPGATSAVGSGSNTTIQRTAASIPRNWLVRMNHSDAQAYTYSVGYALIL